MVKFVKFAIRTMFKVLAAIVLFPVTFFAIIGWAYSDKTIEECWFEVLEIFFGDK